MCLIAASYSSVQVCDATNATCLFNCRVHKLIYYLEEVATSNQTCEYLSLYYKLPNNYPAVCLHYKCNHKTRKPQGGQHIHSCTLLLSCPARSHINRKYQQ